MADNNDDALWLKPLPKEFANQSLTPKRRLIFSGLTAVVLLSFMGFVWISYTSETDNIGPIPVVRADKSVVKEKPDDPGGKEILFRDKEVFNRVDNLPKEQQDVLASSSEIPLKRPVAQEVAVEVPEKTPVAETVKESQVQTKVALSTLIQKPTIGKFVIQIGAFAKKNQAEAYWTTVVAKNTSVMAKLTPIYMKVDIDGKGSLYRVRGGRLQSRHAADDLSAALKKNNHG